ncbi:helix-turn-helix domain-containing protein [Streptomyces sp. KR80]|uniref:helix-turn-helix domain-containing protein n=1 Tax=Streptomyces sp. KR80 TaxID=3457426 RepID=UPI003FD12F50
MTLLLMFEGGLDISRPDGGGDGGDRFGSLVAGLHTRARVGAHEGHLYGIEILLMPWMAFTLFGTPMHDLAEIIVEPAQVLGGRADALTTALCARPDWRERFALLDSMLTHWADSGPAHSPRVAWAWSRLTASGGLVPLDRLAAGAGWGRRQLESRFREQIGLSPKAAARVLRLQGAMRLLMQSGRPSEVAAACGFSDQAHFSREFKAMTGLTAKGFLQEYASGPTWERVEGRPTSVLLVA